MVAWEEEDEVVEEESSVKFPGIGLAEFWREEIVDRATLSLSSGMSESPSA